MTNHEKRVHELLYSTESRTELCECVAALENENAKMREDLDYATRQVDMLTHNASVGSEKPSPDSTDAITLLKAENANLREFAGELLPFTGDTCPEECRYRAECEGEGNRDSDGLPLVCVAYGHYVERARKLGVEVNDA